MMSLIRRGPPQGMIEADLINKEKHHEVGNPARYRFPVRHGNHDVHRQSVMTAGRALRECRDAPV